MSKAKCLKCNDVIESKHRHDFVKCECGEIFLDGGDENIRAGANDLNNILIHNDDRFYAALDRDETLQKLLEDVDTEGMFDDMFDDPLLDPDDADYELQDFNLGYQAGTLDERDRILEILDKNLGHMDWDDLVKLIRKDK
jgi:hypothetical protein